MMNTVASNYSATITNSSSDNMIIISRAEAMNPSRRSTMEDCCVIHAPNEWDNDLYHYIGLYDGHGGRAMVEFLQYGLSYHIGQEISNNNNTTISMQTKLERAFLMTDIHAKLVGINTSGSTAIVCLIKYEESDDGITKIHITTANVGDSRAVLGTMIETNNERDIRHNSVVVQSSTSSYNTTTKRLSIDHRVDNPLEVQRIVVGTNDDNNDSGGFIYKNRVCGILSITRSFGDDILKKYIIAHPYVNEITITKTKTNTTATMINDNNDNNNVTKTKSTLVVKEDVINNNQFLIIACDGLWDVISDEEAVNLVCSYCCLKRNSITEDDDDSIIQNKKQSVANFLIQQALQRKTADNVTVVVVWL